MNTHLLENGLLDVVIIGAGMGGLGAAAKLVESGVGRIAVLERTDGVGGVWRHNRYPNIACDTPIDLYAYSFFLGSRWTTNFASGAEILSYFEDFAENYDLKRFIEFNVEVDRAVWNEAEAIWEIDIADGRQVKSRFLIWAGGILSTPTVPSLQGMGRFGGEMLHTANWHEDLDLTGKHVAVVGSGASAIQVIPYVAEHAAKTYAFVRTPSYVLPRPDVVYSEQERQSPGFFLEQQRNRRKEWFDKFEFIAKARFPMNIDVIEEQEAEWRKHFDATIEDPRLRDILTPRYRFGCKRPLFSNAYYPAMTHPNLTAIGEGITKVEERAVVDRSGTRYPVDVILWATGYDPSHMMGRLQVIGSGGRSLAEQWKDIPSAFFGSLVKGFPNLFLVGGPNIGGASQSDFIEAQLWLIREAMSRSDALGAGSVEVEEDAFDAFNKDIQARAGESVLVRGNCTSWYLSEATGGVYTHWPGTIQAFQARIREEAVCGLRFGARTAAGQASSGA